MEPFWPKTLCMLKSLQTGFISICLMGLLLQSTGCVALVAGGAAAGGTAYMLGDLQVLVETNPKQLRKAITEGCEDLGLTKVSGSGDELEGEYVYRTGADKKVTVSYSVEAENQIEMQIRVGLLGDENLSVRINQSIQKQL